jgi:ketosteroid isomerase-like protein
MIRMLVLLTGLVAVASCAQPPTAQTEAIDAVLDDFHDAAAHGDKDRYLGHLTEYAVFLGTDESERWPKHPDFSDYVDARFQDGSGWSYRSVERQIQLSESADTAWFDEVVYSETNGRFRGTGVVVREDDTWKIAHYAMSFLIYNENWEEVIAITQQAAAQKAAAE